MTIIAKVGERFYEFKDIDTLTKAREIYATCMGFQDEFERLMEDAGIDFLYEFEF